MFYILIFLNQKYYCKAYNYFTSYLRNKYCNLLIALCGKIPLKNPSDVTFFEKKQSGNIVFFRTEIDSKESLYPWLPGASRSCYLSH